MVEKTVAQDRETWVSYGFYLWVRKIPCRRAWQPTPVFSFHVFPGEPMDRGDWQVQSMGWQIVLSYTVKPLPPRQNPKLGGNLELTATM